MSTTDQPPAPADVDTAPRPGGGPAPEEGAPDTLEEWLQGLRTDLVTDPAAWLHPEPAPDAASEPLANETAVGPDGGGEAPSPLGRVPDQGQRSWAGDRPAPPAGGGGRHRRDG